MTVQVKENNNKTYTAGLGGRGGVVAGDADADDMRLYLRGKQVKRVLGKSELESK